MYIRIMSNSDSNSESDFEESDGSDDSDDLSICKELEDLERQLQNTHLALHNSIETLENINMLFTSGKNINVICGGKKCDFDEVLEKLHAAAMETISASQGLKSGEFGEALLKEIDECKFC